MSAIATLNTGDTAWILVATILVLLMSIPGISFFYGGLSKRKNVLNTMFLSIIAFAIISLIWVSYGYQTAFGNTIHGLIGIPTNLFLTSTGIDLINGTIPEVLWIVFQLTFAALTGALIAGAVVGRMKTSAWILFIILWSTFVYIPIAHWVWGGGWLMQLGALDFAGGTVVHINSGVSALALILVLGARKEKTLLPHNLTYSILGAGFLFFGWLGFNGGSALTADGLAANAILVSIVAACAGLIAWIIIDIIKDGKPTVLGAITGLVAGLVAITPAAGFVNVPSAIIIGLITSIISYYAVYYMKEKLGYDDALDVFGVHGCSGIWGSIATGIFAVPFINEASGLLYGNINQFGIQIVATLASIIYAFVISWIIAQIINKTIGLRVDEKVEINGLDTSLHEESGYQD